MNFSHIVWRKKILERHKRANDNDDISPVPLLHISSTGYTSQIVAVDIVPPYNNNNYIPVAGLRTNSPALIRANSPGYGRTGRDPLIWFY